LDNVIGADGATGSGFGGAADTSQSGRNGMTGVVDDTRRGVAAIAPSTDTPAGKRQLVDHLQSELDRAKSLLKVSEQRNVMLAQLIRGGAGGYGGAGSRMGAGGMSPMMGGGMGGMSPMSLGSGGMPNLSSLSSLLGGGRGGRDGWARPGLTLHPPVPTGPGADAFRAAIRRGLTIKGITDPVARANWEAGMMVVGDRESDFNNTAVNGGDSNATQGNHSAGTLQFTGTTFEAYHEPGTSADRGDNVAQVCAFVNYAMGRYGVSADGSDLAAKIQQADPTRPAQGY
jgi:SLT domain-containing protein